MCLVPKEVRRGRRIPWDWTHRTRGCWESKSDPLRGQPVVLSAKHSLSSPSTRDNLMDSDEGNKDCYLFVD